MIRGYCTRIYPTKARKQSNKDKPLATWHTDKLRISACKHKNFLLVQYPAFLVAERTRGFTRFFV